MKKTGEAMGDFDGGMHLALKIFIQELIQLFLFDWRQGVDLGAEFGGIGYQLNGVIPRFQFGSLLNASLAKMSLEFLIRFGDYEASQVIIT